MIKSQRLGLLLSIIFILIISVALVACSNANNGGDNSDSESSAPANDCAHTETEWSLMCCPFQHRRQFR